MCLSKFGIRLSVIQIYVIFCFFCLVVWLLDENLYSVKQIEYMSWLLYGIVDININVG